MQNDVDVLTLPNSPALDSANQSAVKQSIM